MLAFTIQGPQTYPKVTTGLIGQPSGWAWKNGLSYLIPPGLSTRRMPRVQIIPVTMTNYINRPRCFEMETIIAHVTYEEVREYNKPTIKIWVPADTSDNRALVWLYLAPQQDENDHYLDHPFKQEVGKTTQLFQDSLCRCQLLVMNPGDMISFERLSAPLINKWKEDEDCTIHWTGQTMQVGFAREIHP